jgi:hypothetical protein
MLLVSGELLFASLINLKNMTAQDVKIENSISFNLIQFAMNDPTSVLTRFNRIASPEALIYKLPKSSGITVFFKCFSTHTEGVLK